MKILLFGSNGWIGKLYSEYLEKHGYEVIPAISRAENYHDVIQEIARVNPNRVFCSVGRTYGTTTQGVKLNSIDYLETGEGSVKNLRDNLQAQITLANACRFLHIHLTLMHTGCIYTYDSEHQVPTNLDVSNVKGFTENEPPNFFGSKYSATKGILNELLKQYENILILRIRMPIVKNINTKKINVNDRDFISKLYKYATTAKICSIPNSMTVLDDMFPIFEKLMVKQMRGIYNMTNPGVIDHNTILKMFFPELQYENFSQEEQRFILLSDRSNNFMSTTKIELFCTDNGLKLPSILESLQSML